MAAAIRPIYTTATEVAAKAALEEFETGPWGAKYATISGLWRCAWEHVTPFFAFPPKVRRIEPVRNFVCEAYHVV